MNSTEKSETIDQSLTQPESDSQVNDHVPGSLVTAASRLKALDSLPRRHALLHWTAFIFSLVSWIFLALWIFGSQGQVPVGWVVLDTGLCVLFAFELFTRSGFHWTRFAYLRTHFFDFVAIVPVFVLVNHGLLFESVWVWIILIARTARVIDRFLGDGFVRRNALALVEGFEEELTDRILERIIIRIQADLDRASFSHGIAEALARNKKAVLNRIAAATPHEGFVPGLAHSLGLDTALERTEERAFDAVVEVVNSEEIDRTIKDTIDTSFSRLRNEIHKKKWRSNLGLGYRRSK